jgi:hypothetical protein
MQSALIAYSEIGMFTVFSIRCKMVACHHRASRDIVDISTGKDLQKQNKTSKEPVEVSSGAEA